MELTKNGLLNWFSKMKKQVKKNRCFLTLKIDFESTILALFKDPELVLFTKYVQQFC